jgi:hypothetical protein
VDARTQSYPARLQELLGDGFEVRNFRPPDLWENAMRPVSVGRGTE